MDPVMTHMAPVVRDFQIRPATSQDMDRLCELAGQLLSKIHAEGTVKDAQRIFERTMKSSDLGTVLVAEHESGLCGYAYGAYGWRAESRNSGEARESAEAWWLPFWTRPANVASIESAPRSILVISPSSGRSNRPALIPSAVRSGASGFETVNVA